MFVHDAEDFMNKVLELPDAPTVADVVILRALARKALATRKREEDEAKENLAYVGQVLNSRQQEWEAWDAAFKAWRGLPWWKRLTTPRPAYTE